eukprot:TRINITY_DN64041_c0_g1_i1.p1 TRINITY_DN64041_c0_g1~~TRINITY_DN64041_c0_g1_i1.p1  ORF type:complete len:532 (-),score=71.31 TRINITY_DN64041_c0_g1_i1:242-1741(-)
MAGVDALARSVSHRLASARIAALRALLRISRAADRQPSRLVALLGRPPGVFDQRQRRILRTESSRSDSMFVEDAVREACGGSCQYAHPSDGCASRGVRRHYRLARDLDLPSYVDQARQLQQRLQRAASLAASIGAAAADNAVTDGAAVTRAVDDGVTANLDLASVQRRTIAVSGTFQRLPPNATEHVAVGDLLLTHPLSCLFEPVFDQAIVLVDAVGVREGSETTTTGLVLNKPTRVTFGEMLGRWRNAEDRVWLNSIDLEPVAQARIFRGGPVIPVGLLREKMRWLHSYGEGLSGAQQVAPSLWLGGDLADVAARVREGGGRGIRFFLGYAAWSPVQLWHELECGVWARARSGEMQSVGRAERERRQNHGAHAEAAAAAATIQSISAKELGLGTLERGPAWRMALAGAGLHDFASFPRSMIADQRMRRYTAACHKLATEIQDPYPDEVGDAAGAEASVVRAIAAVEGLRLGIVSGNHGRIAVGESGCRLRRRLREPDK